MSTNIEHSMDRSRLAQADRIVRFGPFKLIASERALFVGEEKVELGGRAFDVLVALVSRPFQVISRREFNELVWPDLVVEDVNLRVQIAALRKILRSFTDDRSLIKSIQGRGYCFIGNVSYEDSTVAAISRFGDTSDLRESNGDDYGGLFGRRADIIRIVELLKRHRHVAIVGPGGVGKTAAATAAMWAFYAESGISTCSIDLSSLTEAALVQTAIATALGISAIYESPLEAVARALEGKKILLFLDSCESFVEAVAVAVEIILRRCPNLSLLTTSREPLRVSDEWLCRLNPLPVPDHPLIEDPDEALRWPSVKLFRERAVACCSEFELDAENSNDICEICVALDGLPLAIELAASRIQMFGPKGLRDGLSNRFAILSQGKRTAPPRHQTLRAAIDWSYETLSENEKITLRRVSIFRSSFSMEQAAAVFEAPLSSLGETLECLSGLVDKSLLIPDAHGPTVTFSVLDSTRSYAIEKLEMSGEYDTIARKHARLVCSLFTEPETYSAQCTSLCALAYEPRILNEIRSALDWALNETGDLQLGIVLTWVTAPLFYQLSLFDEYRLRVDKALATLSRLGKPDPDSEFRLLLALASADYHTQSLRGGAATSVYESALELAKRHGSVSRQIQVLYGMVCTKVMAGQYEQVSSLIKEMENHVEKYPVQTPLLHRLQALVHGQSGRFNEAIKNARQSLINIPVHSHELEHRDLTQYDHRATSLAIQARFLWVVGDTDDAMITARTSLTRALELNHKLSIGCSLAMGACPVACWRGDTAEIVAYLQMLESISDEFRLVNCRGEAQCYAYAVLGRDPFQHFSREQLDRLPPTSHEILATVSNDYLTPLAIERAKTGKAGWSTAEIYRVIGENILREDSRNTANAERMFKAARRIAKRQGAFSWELRAATSLARSQYSHGQLGEAEEGISETLERVRQGRATHDVMSARRLLDDIRANRQTNSANATAR